MPDLEKIAQAMDDEVSRWDMMQNGGKWDVVRYELARKTHADPTGSVEVKSAGLAQADAFAFVARERRLAVAQAAADAAGP